MRECPLVPLGPALIHVLEQCHVQIRFFRGAQHAVYGRRAVRSAALQVPHPRLSEPPAVGLEGTPCIDELDEALVVPDVQNREELAASEGG